MVLRVFNRLATRPRLKPIRQRAITAVSEPPGLVLPKAFQQVRLTMGIGDNGATNAGFNNGFFGGDTLDPVLVFGQQIQQLFGNTNFGRFQLQFVGAEKSQAFAYSLDSITTPSLPTIRLVWVQAQQHWRTEPNNSPGGIAWSTHMLANSGSAEILILTKWQ